MAAIEKKMRIQLFDKEFNMLSDRLVSQDIELKGPKEKHDGPIRVEFALFDQDDVPLCITYLRKLLENLPLELKEKKVKISEIDSESREELLKAVMAQATNQEQLIEILREKGFRFLTPDHISDLGLKLEIEEKHKDFQFMVLCMKEAKIASNDRYDPQLAFGIKLLGDKIDRILIYLYGKFDSRVKLEWPAKVKVSFQKMEMVKFPPYMKLEEREKFRNELRMLNANPEKVPSKFFGRWMDDVDFKEKEVIKGKISVA